MSQSGENKSRIAVARLKPSPDEVSLIFGGIKPPHRAPVSLLSLTLR